jgi:hypothetical protein
VRVGLKDAVAGSLGTIVGVSVGLKVAEAVLMGLVACWLGIVVHPPPTKSMRVRAIAHLSFKIRFIFCKPISELCTRIKIRAIINAEF